MYITIQNAFFMAQFIVAIVQNTFVTVDELAKFLNIILGTKTITADSVNNMLVQIPLTDKLCKIETANNNKACCIKWYADVVADMFELEKFSSYIDVSNNMMTKAIQYNLINLDEEFIDIETVKSNLKQLIDVVSIGIENYTEK